MVYIAPRNLKKRKTDWIDKPYENVDYSPFEKHVYEDNPPVKVRGVYVTQASATNASGLLDNLIELADTTPITHLSWRCEGRQQFAISLAARKIHARSQ